MRNLVISLLCGLAASSTGAQSEPDTLEFEGKWSVSIQPVSGRALAARLELANFAGTWQQNTSASSGTHKVCSGKKFPVTVQTSQAAILEFTVWGSAIASTCPDFSVSVRPDGAKVLEGDLSTGERVRLTRP